MVNDMTNVEKIRTMSDEEIAKVLLDWFCIGNQESYTRNRNEVYGDILKWLLSQSLI